MPTTRRVATNFLWLALDRAARFAINFGVSVAMISHLGPADNGLLAACVSIFAIGAAVSEFGLDSLLRRDLVRNTGGTNTLLATTVILRLSAGFLVVPICVWLVLRAGNGHEAAWPLALMLSVLILQPASLVFDSWFNARTAAKHSVWAQTSGIALGTATRGGLVAFGFSVVWFGLPVLLEVLVGAALLAWFFRRQGGSWTGWRWDGGCARRLWLGCWPILLTNLAIQLYMRLDVLFLMGLGGDVTAGIYAAATRLSDLASLVPLLVITATTAGLTALHRDDRARYHDRLQQLVTGVTWLAIVAAAGLSLLASPLVTFLYGEAFAAAAPVLALHAWGAVFAVQGSARGLWLLLEERQRYGLFFVILGLAVNVTLNLTLIPLWGALGAAVAAVSAQFTVAWIAPVLFAPTRPTLRFLVGSLFFRTRCKLSS